MKTLENISNKIQKKAFTKFKAGYQKTKNILPQNTSGKQAVFIAGNQRSGTNMVMDILEKSLATDVYHERDTRAFKNYLMREESVIQNLLADCTVNCFVVKALCESQYLRSFFDKYPSPRGVWIYRSYEDVVNSMLKSFNGMAEQARQIARNPESAGWRGQGMSQQTHQLVKKIVDDSIDDASASALQWYYRNILFFDQQFETDSKVILLKYEELVQNPRQEFKRLFEFLEIPFKEKFVKNVFNTSINKKAPRKIKPEIKEICEGLMEKLNTVYENQKGIRPI